MFDEGKNRIDELRDRQPFRVPEGYFEGFTDDFMRRLPQRKASETKVISLYDRIKPWLYIAAVFAGIIILFNIFTKTFDSNNEANKGFFLSAKAVLEENEDADFLEYLEELYVDKYAISFVMDDF
jgi:hypothetical protein